VYLIFAMVGANGQGTCVTESVAPVLASDSAISGKPSMTGNLLEAYSYLGGEGVGEIPNISEGLWLEKRCGRG